jgi:hypothetical protein
MVKFENFAKYSFYLNEKMLRSLHVSAHFRKLLKFLKVVTNEKGEAIGEVLTIIC